jgi:hypothetical protein
MPLKVIVVRDLEDIPIFVGKDTVVLIGGGGSRPPRNNDGRSSCWWCGVKTERKQGFTAEYDVCPKCEK